MRPRIRFIAFYLPQFHPIPENDKWWGKGFTEWTNTAKAKPLFEGHYQPNTPADLGFYDLRDPETREAQAGLAREHGIDAFCYWHYWFGNGKRLLEKPFNEVLRSGKPDFPFCLGWANESWTGIWHGLSNEVIVEQTYPGRKDYEDHFYAVSEAFEDPRYMRVRQKPLFLVYKPDLLPNAREFTEAWNNLATREGLKGVYFVGIHDNLDWNHKKHGFDAKTYHVPAVYIADYIRRQNRPALPEKLVSLAQHIAPSQIASLLNRIKSPEINMSGSASEKKPAVYDYESVITCNHFARFRHKDVIPSVIPNWDNTPRSSYRGLVLHNSTPELFQRHLESAFSFVESNPKVERIVFIKSWNEWAEGNYLEPDVRWGKQYLEAVRRVVSRHNAK